VIGVISRLDRSSRRASDRPPPSRLSSGPDMSAPDNDAG
jgi:hypothetical protein